MMGMTQAMADTYTSKPRLVDLKTESVGVFAELEQQLGEQTRWISGLRVDDWDADRLGLAAPVSASETLLAAFTRFEYDFADGSATTYFGFGYTERPMDYWEAVSAAGLTTTTQLDPEATSQIDLGFLWRQGPWNGSVSAFYGDVNDYVLVYTGMMPSPRLNSCASGMMSVTCSGNIDATRYGFEANVQGQLSDTLSLKANMAWVRAHNDTHDRALAQTPPLNLTLSLEHKGKSWTSGLVARYIGEQDRIDRGYGTIVGQDISATGEAAILSVHTSTKLTKDVRLALGLDNITDTDYAEHLSRAGSAVEGYPAIDKVSEPGRTWWAKVSYSF
jgi:iron complex outermembrane receptor protein